MSQGPADLQQHPKTANVRRVLMTGGFIAIVAGATATIGISNRAKGIQEIARWTEEQAVPTVAIVTPRTAPGPGELVLPGNVDAYYTGSIFARASGYVKEWYEDIGAHVKKGQVLGLIDTPELDQQLAQARADFGTAKPIRPSQTSPPIDGRHWRSATSSPSRRETRRQATFRRRPRRPRRCRPMWPASNRCRPSTCSWRHSTAW
jgi:hypothetical protein